MMSIMTRVLTAAAVLATGVVEAAFTMHGAGGNGMRRGSDVTVQSFKVHFAPRAKAAPKLDGKLDDACWQGVEPITDYGPCTLFLQAAKKRLPKTETYLTWNDKYLYVAAKCYEDTPENMKSFLNIVNDGKRVFHGRDCIELHIDGNNDEHTTFQCWLLATAEKVIHWNYDFGWGILTDSNYGLNADWDIAHAIDEKAMCWTVEARYALSHFEIKPQVGYIFGLEPARFRYDKDLFASDGKNLGRGGMFLGWGSQGKNHHNADGYGKVILVDKTPISVPEGLRLAYKDLDKRVILVQSGSAYAVFDRGKVSTLTYEQKAKELVAETTKLADRYEKFFGEVSNVVWKTSNWSAKEALKKIAAFREEAAKAAAKKEFTIAYTGELETKCGTWSGAFDKAYWELVRDALVIEKKPRVPVTLHPEPDAPDLNAEFPDRTMRPAERTHDVTEWAKPLAAGRKKVFITVNSSGGIDGWQLAKRMDMDATVFQATGGSGSVGVDGDYYNEGLWFTGVKRQELERALKEKGPFDCFVFIGTGVRTWPAELQCWLLEQVLKGATVLEKNGTQPLLGKYAPCGDVQAGCPLGMKKLVDAKKGGAFDTEYIPVKLATDPLKTAAFGSGTMGRVATPVSQGWAHGTFGTPSWTTKPDLQFQDEYGFAYLVRNLMQLFGCRDGRRAVSVGDGLAEVAADAAVTVPFKTAGAAAWKGEIGWQVRDMLGRVLQSETKAFDIPAGTNHVSLALKPLAVGEYYVDATLYAPGKKVIDFASGRVVAAHREKFVKCGCSPNCKEIVATPQIVEYKLPNRTLFAAEAPVEAVVKVSPAAAGLVVWAEIRDVRERIIVRQEFPVDANTGLAKVSLKNVPEYDWTCANLDVSLFAGPRKLDRKTEPFFRHRGRTEDYEAFTNCPEIGGWFGKHRLAYEQYCGINHFQKASTANFVSYGGEAVFRDRIPGGAPDKGGSLANPWWLKDLRARYAKHARSLRTVNGRFVSLGDDSGEPNDFPSGSPDWVPCWVARQLATMRRYAAQWERDGANSPMFQATRQWIREYGVKMNPSGYLEGWNFTLPLQHRTMAIVKDGNRTPLQVKEYVACFREVYGTIEKFNRASGLNVANWDAITGDMLATAKWDPSPEYVNFLFWLKARYRNDIAKLNAAWKSNVKSFTEIPRALIDEQLAAGNYVPSFDMQNFLEEIFINQARAIAEGIHGEDAQIGLGFGASTLGNTFCDSIKWIDSVCPYEGGYDVELLRGQKHKFVGECIGVYGGRNVPEPMRKRQVWHGLLTGCNFSWFWCASYLPGDSTVDPRQHGAMFEAYREIKRGPAALCLRSKRDNYGVKLMVSRDAGHLAPFLKDMSTHGQSQGAFGSLTESLGLQWDSVTGEQVGRGDILRDGTKVLLLPYLQAIRTQEANVIREFVKKGGTVVADARVGLFSEKGVPYAKPALDDVFGVTTGPKALPKICDVKVQPAVSNAVAATLAGALVDTSVKPTTAKAWGTTADGAVAFLVNDFGKGRAVLFNINLAVISFLDGRGELGGVRDALEQLVALAGLKPFAVMKDASGATVTRTEFTKHVRGDAIYLGVEKLARVCEKFPMEAYVQLPKKYWVYDVRAGKALGFTDRIPMTLGGLDIGLYALLPNETKAIALEIPAEVKRGEALKATAKVVVAGTTSPQQQAAGMRVLRWELIPEGGYSMEEFMPYPWRVKDAPGGEGATQWAIGFNEIPGTKFTAVVTDVATGASASKVVTVK